MIVDYDVIFKLPCEKTFTFNISVSADDYDPTTEVGKHPSRLMLDYFLLYVPQLQEYSSSEISNGTVVSVRRKKNDEPKRKNINTVAETESEHKEEPTPSFKSLYWKNGYIVKSRGNGYGIISNDVIFYKEGSTHKSDLDDSLMDYFFTQMILSRFGTIQQFTSLIRLTRRKSVKTAVLCGLVLSK